MTIEEFDKMKWSEGVQCKFNNEIAAIVGVLFHDKALVVIPPNGCPTLTHCENVELVE